MNTFLHFYINIKKTSIPKGLKFYEKKQLKTSFKLKIKKNMKER